MKPLDRYTHKAADYLMFMDMLRMARPADSAREAVFIKEFLVPLGVEHDAYGNIYKRIGKAPVAWSSHTDTVHTGGGTQLIMLDQEDKRTVKLHPESKANCLGADDTAGVWLMVQMIRANRPGLYIFHRGEERGCKGSRWIIANTPKLVEGIETMIALDRRGFDSVITHQLGQRCCSKDFGESLFKEINKNGVSKFKLDDTGSFTDSAVYTDLIGECTNLSVGYESQHSCAEKQDLIHLYTMRDTLLQLDVRDLVFKRKPGEKDSKYASNYWGGHGTDTGFEQRFRGGYYDREKDRWVNESYIQFQRRMLAQKRKELKGDKKTTPKTNTTTVQDVPDKPPVYVRKCFVIVNGKKVEDTVENLVLDYPEEVAAMLVDWGFGAAFIRDEIQDRVGLRTVLRGFSMLCRKEEKEDQELGEGGNEGTIM